MDTIMGIAYFGLGIFVVLGIAGIAIYAMFR